jgi:hypothetical protein
MKAWLKVEEKFMRDFARNPGFIVGSYLSGSVGKRLT